MCGSYSLLYWNAPASDVNPLSTTHLLGHNHSPHQANLIAARQSAILDISRDRSTAMQPTLWLSSHCRGERSLHEIQRININGEADLSRALLRQVGQIGQGRSDRPFEQHLPAIASRHPEDRRWHGP